MVQIRPGYIYIETVYHYPPTKEELISALDDFEKMGFDFVELEAVRLPHLEELVSQMEEWKAACDDRGLSVSNFVVILPEITSLDESIWQNAIEGFERATCLARYLGCETVDLDSFTPRNVDFPSGLPYLEIEPPEFPPKVRIQNTFCWHKQWKIFVKHVKECAQVAASQGLRLAIHPRAYEIISNTDDFLRLYDAVGEENLGYILDIAHLHAQKELLPLSIEKAATHISHVHLADNDGKSLAHLPVGHGTIHWDPVFSALRKHRFDGQFVIDISPRKRLDEAFVQAKRFVENVLG